MNVIVVLTVVAVVLSCTLEYSQARDGDITSRELCEQLKSNERRVLTMGARGRSQEDAHFYILMEGGYMFKVPLANLHVDATNMTTSLNIDKDFLRADVYFNVSRDIFSRDYLFFLISNRNKDAFLGQLYYCQKHSKSAFQLFDLNGIRTFRDHPQEMYIDFYNKINVMGSYGIDSYITYGFELRDKKLYRFYAFEENKKDELEITEGIGWFRYFMDMSSNTKLATVFYHKEDPNKDAGYYYFLDADGFITVTRREDATEWVHDASFYKRPVSSLYSARFEVKLSSFVVCDYQTAKSDPQSPQSSPSTTTNTTAQNGSSTIYHRYWAIPLGIGAILVLGGIALYWFKRRQRKKNKKNKNKKNKNKNKPRDDSVVSSLGTSNISSNLNSSNDTSSFGSSNSTFAFVSNPTTTSSLASSASSALQSVKSKIASLLKGNKSKQAKAVTKGKDSKVKPKKPKSKAKSPKSP